MWPHISSGSQNSQVNKLFQLTISNLSPHTFSSSLNFPQNSSSITTKSNWNNYFIFAPYHMLCLFFTPLLISWIQTLSLTHGIFSLNDLFHSWVPSFPHLSIILTTTVHAVIVPSPENPPEPIFQLLPLLSALPYPSSHMTLFKSEEWPSLANLLVYLPGALSIWPSWALSLLLHSCFALLPWPGSLPYTVPQALDPVSSLHMFPATTGVCAWLVPSPSLGLFSPAAIS